MGLVLILFLLTVMLGAMLGCPDTDSLPCWSCQRLTFLAPPKSRQATAFLMSAWPKMLGATFSKMRSCKLGCAAYALNSASSSLLQKRPSLQPFWQPPDCCQTAMLLSCNAQH